MMDGWMNIDTQIPVELRITWFDNTYKYRPSVSKILGSSSMAQLTDGVVK